MMREIPPSAEGDLGRTPLAHLLVYAVDRRLTGALRLSCPVAPGHADVMTHVVRFARGTPVKTRPGDGYARLGGMLVEYGAISETTLQLALATHGLLGDVLLLAGCIDRTTLEQVAEQQFIRRMVRLFALPPVTTFAYYDGDVELIDWGGDPASVDALNLLWLGLKEHAEESTMIDSTLGRLGEAPLQIHKAAVLSRFRFQGEARRVIDRIADDPVSYEALLRSGVAPPPVVRSVVYAMAITRQLDLGTSSPPVGADDVRRSLGMTTLAKLKLKVKVHRHVPAAPDPPGTGEREPVRRPHVPSSVPPRSGERTSFTDLEDAVPSSGVAGSRDEHSEPLSEFNIDAPESTAEVPEVPELMAMARECLDESDLESALQACTLAHELEPGNPEPEALSVWIRALQPAADLEALMADLDQLLADQSGCVAARYYRSALRRRLGDDAGAARDLRRVLELDPMHELAVRDLAALGNKHPSPSPSSIAIRRK